MLIYHIMPHPEYEPDYRNALDNESRQIWANIHVSQLVEGSRVGITRPEMMELSVWQRELAIDAATEAVKLQKHQDHEKRKEIGTKVLEAIGHSFVLFSPYALTAAYFRKRQS